MRRRQSPRRAICQCFTDTLVRSMGCTPSLHLSEAGVIYCQDSDDSPSSYSGANHQIGVGGSGAGVHGQFKNDSNTADTSPEGSSRGGGGATSTPGTMRAIRSGLTLPCLSHSRQTSEAETQTTNIISPMRETREIQFGSMKIKLSPMKVMLVFGSEDSQSDAFWWAADKLKYQCTLVRTPEMALENYLKVRYDLIIIDNRHSKHFDADALCRTIRSTTDSDHTVIVAVVKKSAADKEEASILPLLKSGFNRWFIECPSLGVCLNELLQLEMTEVTTRHLLRAAMSLFVALDRCRDAVEITNADNEIEYVNVACEKLLGYNSEELLGKNIQDIHKNDHIKVNIFDSINLQLNKGKVRGMGRTLFSKRKQGESIPLVCHATPVFIQGKRIEHLVYVKEYPSFWDKSNELLNGKEPSHISALDICPYPRGSIRKGRKGSYDIRSLKSEGYPRRQSIAKTYSMTIEAPITKVINLITAAQENSPIYIAQALDKVLEILRSTELYSPQFLGTVKVEDPIATDLLGGLLSQGPKPIIGVRRSSNESSASKGHSNVVSALSVSNILANVPSSIKAVLESEAKWDFDILQLERVTEKRPLVWLGMATFIRFDAFSYLKCNETTLQNWLTLIEANYHSQNAYHNSTHAADVLQATAYFLKRDKLKEIIDPLDAVGCLIAAVVHDVDHPGKTSPFLCNSRNELAILYNDLSVLESHHAAMAFKLTFSDERVNIFNNLERESYQVLRQTIIDMVLATEMTKHFEHLSKFVNVWTKPVLRDDESISGESTRESADAVSLITPENISVVKRMLIKCADISNPVRPLHLCIEWAKRIAEEYFSQTEEEKALGLPVCMPVFDRTKCSIPKSQTGFIDIFIRDMFEALDGFAEIPEIMERLRINYQYWKDQEQMVNSVKEQRRASAAAEKLEHNGTV